MARLWPLRQKMWCDIIQAKQYKTHVRMVNFGNIKNRAIRKLGDKAVAALGGAADRKLGKKGGSVARAALQEAQAQYLPGTAGIPGWVPKGTPYTNVRKMQAFYRDREPYNPPARPTYMVNRYVTQNTWLGRETKM